MSASIEITSPNPIDIYATAPVNTTGSFTFAYTPNGADISPASNLTGTVSISSATTHQTYTITFQSDYTASSWDGNSGTWVFDLAIPAGFLNALTGTAFAELDITLGAINPSDFADCAFATESVDLFMLGTGATPPPPPPKLSPEEKAACQSAATTLSNLSDALAALGGATDPLHPVIGLAGNLASALTNQIASVAGQGSTAAQASQVNSAVQTALSLTSNAIDFLGGSLNPAGLTLFTASVIDSMAAALLQALANDPPDGNFTTVYQAPALSYSIPGATATDNTLLNDSWVLLQDAANMLEAAERYQGAEYAGDTASQTLQTNAFNAALTAFNAQEQAVSTDLQAFVTKSQGSISDVNLSTSNSFANAVAYLKVLSNPLTGDPFLAAFIASIDSTAPNLASVINGEVLNALTALENMQAPALSGSAFAAISSAASQLTPTTTASSPGLLGSLSVEQQAELIYIGYFNRSADPGGFGFWEGQDATAQAHGQSASVALTNIANSFAPQPETIAIYPFLSSPTPNYSNPTVQAGLTSFIGNVYENLFDRAADSGGSTYWVGQIESGAVGLGAAVLAIANGATGSDAVILQNKIAVALDFTNLTSAANLPTNSALVAEANAVLAGVDGVYLNDTSVAAAEALIAPWITSQMSAALVGSAAHSAHLALA